jgi:hypothetical protein
MRLNIEKIGGEFKKETEEWLTLILVFMFCFGDEDWLCWLGFVCLGINL